MPLLLLLTGCLALKGGLVIGESPTTLTTEGAADPRWLDLRDCEKALDEAQCEAFKSTLQTWSEVPGFEGASVRLVVAGDTGKRHDADPIEDAVLVRDAARWACGEQPCDAALFLGDNIYQAGVEGPVETAFLGNFTRLWLGTVERIYFTQGNHDWKPVSPDRDRSQRLHRDIRHVLGDRVHGASHFWHGQLGPLRVASLDSNWFVRKCRTDGGFPGPLSEDADADWSNATVDCGDEVDWLAGMGRVVGDAGGDSTVVVAHHPWYGNGQHGTAGWYRDVKSFSLGRGEAWRAVLEQQVRPRASLFLSGHDHQVAVHLDPAQPGDLAVVVGSGSKVSSPGDRTGEGEVFHQDHMALEAHCRLGFALVQRDDSGLSVDVYSLAGAGYAECAAEIDKRRGPHAANRGTEPAGLPEALTQHDLTCRRFELTDGAWQPALCAP